MILLVVLLFSAFPGAASPAAKSESGIRESNDTDLPHASTDFLPPKITLIDGQDIRFRRLSAGVGLSQSRVATVVQDDLGFIWFGTQYGLNRYDGYRSKTFKHEPGRSDSLSCVYIHSLFVDRSGRLWVGCDRYLDRYEPVTETFVHFPLDKQVSEHVSTPIERIHGDSAGILWLATDRGLYRFDPTTGATIRYSHNPSDAGSIAGNRINFTSEDREGRFWIANSGGLDEFDRNTGRVIRHAAVPTEIAQFHEDKFGVFWTRGHDASCALGTFNKRTNLLTCHSIVAMRNDATFPVAVSGIIESRDGTMWLGSSDGVLKLDREKKEIVSYHHFPSDEQSPESDDVIYIYQDNERNIWACFQETAPNFFSETPQTFENFTYQRGTLVARLVTAIYEDHNSVLWIGSMGGMNRIDRRSRKNTVPAGTGIRNEVLSILEDPSGALVAGTYHQGVLRLDPETGRLTPYIRSRQPSNISNYPIMRLMFARDGTLWAATYGGLSRLDRASGNFVSYTPDKQNVIQYQEIKEDSQGILWLGAHSGLHRFDPRTGQFKIYAHDPDNPLTLSDDRVNSIHVGRTGEIWLGTQNGLDRFSPGTGTFRSYYEQDGLAGNVVSCILEDERGVFWMGTNKGLSSFDPKSETFQNFSVADGLPGPDLTGWGACYKSPAGEMFFGGFSGATAFYPTRTVNSSFVPKTVLTDFRLSGNPVPIGPESALKQSITYTDSISLSQSQNIFSIEFSALTYFNAETNRYRYRLDGLDDHWHEVGSDQRTASYTTLPAAIYTFHVQGATSRGKWSEPGASLRIEILPAWYRTSWFLTVCSVGLLGLLFSIYRLRLAALKRQFDTALEARLGERTRIARELHDTLLQSLHGLLFQFQAARNMLPQRTGEAMRTLDEAISATEQAVAESRGAIHDLRADLRGGDLGESLKAAAQELADSQHADSKAPEFDMIVEGERKSLPAVLQDEVYRIAREILRNAFQHANADRIEVEIRYYNHALRLRIRDNGKGIDPKILKEGGCSGHWGLRGVRERAQQIGAQLDFWSEVGAGTEVQLKVPAAAASEVSGDGAKRKHAEKPSR
jgi:signal transduction histidine kinase/ligand-binding sensor domain-containing protein